MELIIVFLGLIPVLGFALEKIGIGWSRHTEILLPSTTAEIIRSALVDFSRSHNWALLVEEPTADRLLYTFKSGQFGFSKEGAQKITVSFFPSAQETKCFILSESLLGQFFDFSVNQKNIESLSFYLSELLKHQDSQSAANQATTFLPPRSTVHPKYWILLVSALVIIIGTKALYKWSRVIVPGRVIITFKPLVTVEIAQKLLEDFGAINCQNADKLVPTKYECEVPLGQEEEVADAASSNTVVQSAEPKYRN